MRTEILMSDNRLLEIKQIEENTICGSLDALAIEMSKLEPASRECWMIGVFRDGTRENIRCYYIGTADGLFWWRSVSGKWLLASIYREDIEIDLVDQTLQKAKYAWPIRQQFETEFREEI